MTNNSARDAFKCAVENTHSHRPN